MQHVFCVRFICAITLSNLFIFRQLLERAYFDKIGTKRHENHQSLLNDIYIMHCETQHVYLLTTNISYVTYAFNVIII